MLISLQGFITTALRVGLFALAATLTVTTAAASAGNQPDGEPVKPETTKVRLEPIGHWANSRLSRAHAALAEEKYDEALVELDDMMHNKHLNSHERASMYQAYGYLYAARGEHEEAVEAFESCLAENGLPQTAQLSTRKNVAQLYLMLGDYERAVSAFAKWIAEVGDPGADGYYMMALAHAHQGDIDGALPYAERAVERSEKPHEGRLQLLSAIYFRQERFADLVPLLEMLVEDFPKKSYWMQLSAVYAQLDRRKEALAIQESAYEQGMLTEHREFVTLARLFLQNEVPYEAAEVLEDGLAKGIVEENEDAFDLLGSAYLQAREYKKAVGPLARAASLSSGGDAYLRLGEVYLGEEQYREAGKAIRAALAKGSLTEIGRAYLLLGIAQSNEADFDDAKASFATARGYEKYASAAKQWLDHVEREAQLAHQEASSSGSAKGQVSEDNEHS
jgi:tetratricopeptide (TPR) repeat protein